MGVTARSLRGLALVVGACAAALTGTASATRASSVPSGWTIHELGTLGGDRSAATAINDRGQIVGWSTTRSGARHAFLWENGRIRDLGTLGGRQSAALALNEKGQIVGWSTTKTGTKRAVIWSVGGVRPLPWGGPNAQIPARVSQPSVASSVATGINEDGDVSGYWWRVTRTTPGIGGAGSACRGPGATCSFGGVWHRGVFIRLGSIGGSANAIDDAGVVAGSNSVFHNLPGRTILWREYGNHVTWFQAKPGVAYGLVRTSGSSASSPWPLVVGWTLANGRRQASLWYGDYREPPVMLGTLGGPTSVAYGINGRSQVVGESSTKRGGTHAFVWQAGTMSDLGTLPGGRGSSAAGIDARGRIVGWSNTRGGYAHAVLWTHASTSS